MAARSCRLDRNWRPEVLLKGNLWKERTLSAIFPSLLRLLMAVGTVGQAGVTVCHTELDTHPQQITAQFQGATTGQHRSLLSTSSGWTEAKILPSIWARPVAVDTELSRRGQSSKQLHICKHFESNFRHCGSWTGSPISTRPLSGGGTTLAWWRNPKCGNSGGGHTYTSRQGRERRALALHPWTPDGY